MREGRLRYSAVMGGGIEPISFDVDISGVSDFEISLIGVGSSYYYSRGYAHLANVEIFQ